MDRNTTTPVPSRPSRPTTTLLLLLSLLALAVSPSSSSSSRVLESRPVNDTSSTPRSCRGAAPAIFAFGDSTVDSGNNNFLPTAFRSNFPPYGRDFFDHAPTGRFSNGKLATDFAASYLGLKDHLPPYLDLSLGQEELMTGVSFASAGSGFDLLTAQLTGVIPVPLQVGLFQTYQARLQLMVGADRTADLIRRAVFVVSAGTNDFVANYFPLPVRQKDFNVQQYETFLMEKIRGFLQELLDVGAQKVVVAGLPPIGCLPVVITLNWRGRYQERGCIEYYNSIAREYNEKLQAELQGIFREGGAKVYYADIYNPLVEVISAPTKFGFQETMSGCCGTGLLEAAFLCNNKSLVCPDASKYVFWDSIHPTEKTYSIVFNALRPSIDHVC